MTLSIVALDAIEILDSRGNPTLRVWIRLSDGSEAYADVPSGVSRGTNEALERRDDEDSWFDGYGVRRAVAGIRDVIRPALLGRDPTCQPEVDQHLIELDGTANKARLGSNATVGVSMAVARVASMALHIPLYKYLGGSTARRLPVPMMTVIDGGKHANNGLEFQEFMIVPRGAPAFSEGLRYVVDTFRCLRAILHQRGLSTAVGDEGGFAPDLESNEQACQFVLNAIEDAGYKPGEQIAIALDAAATTFVESGSYAIRGSGVRYRTTAEMIDLYHEWACRYPIVSIEDGLGEDDWEGFRQLTARLGDKTQIVGDDLYTTNVRLLRRGVAEMTTNAALIKLNQIGTLTETVQAIELCRQAGWGYVISHRSGDTADPFIADFAVAMGGGQIKSGAPCRGERIAKYNRLLTIERELRSQAQFWDPFAGLE